MGGAREWGTAGLGVLATAAAEAPREAGVYLFLDENGHVLYVGKAANIRRRLRQHAAWRRPVSYLDGKYDRVRRVVWEPAADEEAASWREEELIFALRPPFNAGPDLRGADPVRKDAPVPYIVVTDVAPGVLTVSLEPDVVRTGRAYGCFPHLGKGMGGPLGIACSDGYTALLRLLWAAAGDGTHVPAAITRSAPSSFTIPVPADVGDALHRFLSGTRARLASELREAAARRPAFMQPALRRDEEAALRFYAAGPRRVRARRLRHGVRARVLDARSYRALVVDEIAPVIDGRLV